MSLNKYAAPNSSLTVRSIQTSIAHSPNPLSWYYNFTGIFSVIYVDAQGHFSTDFCLVLSLHITGCSLKGKDGFCTHSGAHHLKTHICYITTGVYYILHFHVLYYKYIKENGKMKVSWISVLVLPGIKSIALFLVGWDRRANIKKSVSWTVLA